MLDLYLQYGWSLNSDGKIWLRSLGDKDDFDWGPLGLDQVNELYDILRKKAEVGEDPAVHLLWKDTGVGALTTFNLKECSIVFLLVLGSKRHPELPEWTDVSWYLPRILNPLLTNGIAVGQIEFTDYV